VPELHPVVFQHIQAKILVVRPPYRPRLASWRENEPIWLRRTIPHHQLLACSLVDTFNTKALVRI